MQDTKEGWMWTEIAVYYPYFFSLDPAIQFWIAQNKYSSSGGINLKDQQW